jgi:phenylalanine-4-hydroxylase
MHFTTLQSQKIGLLQNDHDLYERIRSNDEKETWYKLYSHVDSLINKNTESIADIFTDGFKQLSLKPDVIPTMSYLNKRLQTIGWSISYVHGFISTYQFAYLLTNRKYPININIRSKKRLLYSAEPDLVHDIIGHLPMLLSEEMRSLLCTWAHYTIKQRERKIDISLYQLNVKIIQENLVPMPDKRKINNLKKQLTNLHKQMSSQPSPIWLLGNFFDWVFEFGLLKSSNQYKIYGAAIITSINEMQSVHDSIHRISPLNTEILNLAIGYAINQRNYYYVADCTDYFSLLHSLVPNIQ